MRYSTIAYYLDVVAKLTGFTVELDAIMEKLFKVSTVKDTVSGGAGIVDDEFVFRGGCLWSGGLKHQDMSLLRR